MFRDDRQRSDVCRLLLADLRLHHLWGEYGPSETAIELVEADGGYLSAGERVLLLVAADLWGSSGGLAFSDLLRLDNSRLRLVGELLVSVADGAAGIDRWLARREAP